MRKPSKMVARELLTDTQEKLNIAELALHYLGSNAQPDASEGFPHGEDGRYELNAYGLTRACGGIVVQVWHCEGQTPSTSVYRLDDLANMQYTPLAVRCAVGRLVAERQRMWDRERNALIASHGASIRQAA